MLYFVILGIFQMSITENSVYWSNNIYNENKLIKQVDGNNIVTHRRTTHLLLVSQVYMVSSIVVSEINPL